MRELVQLKVGSLRERNFMKDEHLYLIDSNILIYAYEKEESEKKKRAQRLLSKAFSGEVIYAISSQNLAEFAAAFIIKGKGDIKKLQRSIKGLSKYNNFIKVNYSSQTINNAISLCDGYSRPFWDALIAATMFENNIHHIYTENTSDFKIEGIKAINPLE